MGRWSASNHRQLQDVWQTDKTQLSRNTRNCENRAQKWNLYIHVLAMYTIYIIYIDVSIGAFCDVNMIRSRDLLIVVYRTSAIRQFRHKCSRPSQCRSPRGMRFTWDSVPRKTGCCIREILSIHARARRRFSKWYAHIPDLRYVNLRVLWRDPMR